MPAPNPYNSDSSDSDTADAETRRLRQAYAAYPKIRGHGETTRQRHSEIQPEWIMSIIENPYDEWLKPDGRKNLAGRIPQFNQWIMVILEPHDGGWALLTAYANRGLEKKYGGRPWETE